MVNLADKQFDLGGFVFGAGTTWGTRAPSIEAATVRTHDVPVPAMDGVRQGREYRGSRRWTFDFRIVTGAADPFAVVGPLETAWLANDARFDAGEPVVLRYARAGETRRVYGRPRKFAAVLEHTDPAGFTEATGEFVTMDHLFYADEPVGVDVGLFARSTTGVTGPVTGPGTETGVAATQNGTVTVGGDVPTRLIHVRFEGPCTDPGLKVVGRGEFFAHITLGPSDVFDVAVHPSLRAATLNGAGDFTGTLSGNFDELSLAPGVNSLRFVADNLTTLARMVVTAHPAFASF